MGLGKLPGKIVRFSNPFPIRLKNALVSGIGAALGLFFVAGKPAAAQTVSLSSYYSRLLSPVKERVRLLTTHPGTDIFPSLSPDGRWLLFASDRSGNLDIWAKQVGTSHLVQLTQHKSDDTQPIWLPNQKGFVFVSKRSDGMGDIFLAKLRWSRGRPRVQKITPLTTYLGYDAQPAVSPDGKWLAFTSTRRTNRKNVWLLNFSTQRFRLVVQGGSFSPAFSPDGRWLSYTRFRKKAWQIEAVRFLPAEFPVRATLRHILYRSKKPIGFAVWPNTDRVLFVGFLYDTNGDGQVSVTDNGVLLECPFSEKLPWTKSAPFPLRQLTTGAETALFPNRTTRDSVLFVSRPTGNDNVLTIPTAGAFPVPASRDSFFVFLRKKFSLKEIRTLQAQGDSAFVEAWQQNRQHFLLQRLFVLHKALENVGRKGNLSRLYFEIGETDVLLGYTQAAMEAYTRAVRNENGQNLWTVQARLRIFQLRHLSPSKEMKRLSNLLQKTRSGSENWGLVALRQSVLLIQTGRLNRALTQLQKIAALPFASLRVQAYLTLGDLYVNLENFTSAVQAYVAVLRLKEADFYDRQMALLQLKKAVRTNSAWKNPVRGYQYLLQTYPKLPILQGWAELQIAGTFRNSGDFRTAIREYNRALDQFPNQRETVFRSLVGLIFIYDDLHDSQALLETCQSGLSRFSSVLTTNQIAWIREVLIRTLLAKGERLLAKNDWQLARSAFSSVLGYDSLNVQAHRGMVKCADRAHELQQIIALYHKKLTQHPKREVYAYSLGLAYSYLATRQKLLRDEYALLLKSNRFLGRALRLNYTLVYAYLTLGFNYETLAGLEISLKNQPRPFLERATEAVLAPIFWAYRTITFQKPPVQHLWYEKAIDLLTVGVSINDEKKNPELEAKLSLNLANNYYRLGEFGYEKAFFYYQKRLELDSTFDNIRQEAIVYEQMGHCAMILENWPEAEKDISKAISIYKSLKNQNRVLANMDRLAWTYFLSGDYDLSVDTYLQVLKMVRARQDIPERERTVERLHRNLANAYLKLHDFSESLKHLQLALNLLDTGKIKDKRSLKGYLRLEFLGYSIPVFNLAPYLEAGGSKGAFTVADERALLYTLLSKNYEGQKSLLRAIDALRAKQQVFEKEKYTLGVAIIQNNLGYLYSFYGDQMAAWQAFVRSYRLCLKKKYWSGAVINLNNLARLTLLFWTQKQLNGETAPALPVAYEEVLHWLDGGEQILHKLPYGLARERVALLYQTGLLQTLIFLKEKSAADSNRTAEIQRFYVATRVYQILDRALDEAVRFHLNREQIVIRKNRSEIDLFLGWSDEAKKDLEKARRLALRTRQSDLLWRVDLALGLLQEGKSTAEQSALKKASRDLLQESISILENTPDTTGGRDLGGLNALDRDLLYSVLIQRQVRAGQAVQALQTSEAWQQKQLLDVLAGYRLKAKRETDKIFLGNVRFLREEIARLENENRRFLAETVVNYRAQAAVQAKLDSLKAEYRQLIDQKIQNDPELLALVQPIRLRVSKFQSILAKGQAFLKFQFGFRHGWVWLVSPDTVRVFPLQSGSRRLVPLVRQALRARPKYPGADPTFRQLGAILLKPLQGLQSLPEQLIVIPDRVLAGFPFELLPFRGGLLADSIAVRYATSLTTYFFEVKKRHLSGRKIAYFRFGQEKWHPQAPVGSQLLAVTGRHAEESAFWKAAPDADVLHFNLPLENDPFQPVRSALIFHFPRVKVRSGASEPISPFPPKNNGRLRFQEIFQLDTRANFLALTTDSALAESGFFSTGAPTFVQAFTYAGVPEYLFQLWPVPAKARRFFWNAFYARLFAQRDFDAFLASRKALRRKFRDPRVWGAFVWYGFGGMSEPEKRQFARTQLNATFKRGYVFAKRKDWWDAIRNYEQALQMAHLLGAKDKEAILYQQLLLASYNGKFWERAVRYQEILNRLYESQGDRESLLDGLRNLLIFYEKLGNLEKVKVYRLKYENLLTKMGSQLDQAEAFHQIARLQENASQYDQALTYYRRSLNLYRKLGKKAAVVENLLDLARIYLRYKDAYSQAITTLERAAAVAEEQPFTQTHMTIFRYLGLAYERLGSYQTALEYQQKAAALAEKSGTAKDRGLEHQYLANVFWKMGDYLHAVQHQEKAIAIFQKLGETVPLLLAYSTKGLIHMSLNEPQKGLAYENQALKLARGLHDSLDEATILKNIGLILGKQARWDSARVWYERAVAIDSALGARRGLGYDFRNLGLVFLRQKKFRLAKNYLRKGLALSRSIRDERNVASCQLSLARLFAETARSDSAFALTDSAVALSQKLEIPELEWQGFDFLGDLWARQDSLQNARKSYQKAIHVIEKMRAQIRVENFQTGFLSDKMAVYGKMIALLVRMKKPRQSFEFAERAKSRSFIDLLGNRKIDFGRGASQSDLARGRAIRNKIQRLQNDLTLLYQKGEWTPVLKDSVKKVRARLDSLRGAYDSFLNDLKIKNPELASMVTVEPVSAAVLQKTLDDSTALLAYYSLPTELVLWVLKRDTLTVFSRKISAKRLQNLVRLFRQDLQKSLPVSDEAKRLYRVLIDPADGLLNGISQLVIVPHAVLHYLPFGALMDKKDRYLLDRFKLANAPSGTVYKFCLQKGDHFRQTKKIVRNVLAVGNPDLGNPRYDLPFAEKEAESLKRTFSNVTVYLRKEATETRVKREIRKFDLVLFSTHGEYDPVNPLFSALRLTPDKENDGRLEAWEIFGLQLNQFLVTMSACETGLGKVTSGDEVIGLSRSFIYAGTPAVVASLWKVDDLTTAVIMKRFHRYLHRGYSRAEALKRAQNYVRQFIHPYPYYWAAFYLTGDPR